MTRTGVPTSEIGLVVSNAGSVLYQPAVQTATGFPLGILRSTDRGASWDFILPSGFNEPPRITGVDQDITVDRDTGRIFWLMGRPGGTAQTPRLDMSDDDGETWFQSPSPPVPLDHSQVFTGKPPKALRGKMRGYPNVLYACQGNFPQVCQTSFDGGLSFGPAVPVPFPPEAGTNCHSWGLRGAVDKDGTVYIPLTPCQKPYVAISHDAGQTWQHVMIANREEIGFGEMSLDLDGGGNLYAAWVDSADRLPYLAVSREHGLHWGTPQMIAPPGVNEAALTHLTAGKKGQVTVAYYASKNSPGVPFPPSCNGLSLSCPGYQSETWDTYMTETWNAVAPEPVYWSATLNNPAHPTWYGCSPSEIGVTGKPGTTSGCLGNSNGAAPYWGRLDYFGITRGPEGTAWAGFAQECPNGSPVPGNPSCPSTIKGTAPDSLYGLVGRLVRVDGDDNGHDDD